MTTMDYEQALAIVARKALDTAAHDIKWEDYPDISEDDWTRILAKIDGWSRWTDPDGRYPVAYELLAARTNASQEARP